MRTTATLRRAGVSLLGTTLALGLLATSPAAATEDGRERRTTLLRSAIEDTTADTAALPLLEGRVGSVDGPTVEYVITESSSRRDAGRRGLNYAPRLEAAAGTDAVQDVEVVDGIVVFPATVDFSPELTVVPGDGPAFPPAVAQPGSIGDEGYSPLIQLPNGTVLNAPQVANESGDHDKLLERTVDRRGDALGVFRETEGFYEGEEVYYVSFDASDPTIAALEAATYAPALNAAPTPGSDDDESARSAIVPFINGQTGVDNPDRQGLESALRGEGDPLNVIDSLPENSGSDDYSPLWDVHATVYTDAAIAAGLDVLQTDVDDVRDLAEDGYVTGPGGAPWGAVGVIVNCPVISVEK